MSVQLSSSASTTTQTLLTSLQSSYNSLEPFPETTDYITILETIYTSFQSPDNSTSESISFLLRRLNKHNPTLFQITFQTHLSHIETFLTIQNVSLIYPYLTLLYEIFTTTAHSAYITEWCFKLLPHIIELSTLSQALPANVIELIELVLTTITNKFLVFDNHDILLSVISEHKTTEIAHKAGKLLFDVINVHDEQQRLTLIDWNEVFTIVMQLLLSRSKSKQTTGELLYNGVKHNNSIYVFLHMLSNVDNDVLLNLKLLIDETIDVPAIIKLKIK
jgi:hypothetical protein